MLLAHDLAENSCSILGYLQPADSPDPVEHRAHSGRFVVLNSAAWTTMVDNVGNSLDESKEEAEPSRVWQTRYEMGEKPVESIPQAAASGVQVSHDRTVIKRCLVRQLGPVQQSTARHSSPSDCRCVRENQGKRVL